MKTETPRIDKEFSALLHSYTDIKSKNKGRPAPEEPRVVWDVKGNIKLELFLECMADEVLYGGAAGGGKSEGLAIDALGKGDCSVFNNVNWKVLMLRRTFTELDSSLIHRLQELLYGIAKYDAQKHRFTFGHNGGMIQFGHIKNDDDVTRFHSTEWAKIMFDELTTFTERMYLYLFSRLRTRDKRIKPSIRAATNPGGIGHAWVKQRFIEGKKPCKIYHDPTVLPDGRIVDWTRTFIPATVFDNKIIMENSPTYVRTLMELNEVERKALLYGDWDIFSGQYFTEFGEHNIIDDFEVPRDWPIFISMDYGWKTKCAIGFFTEDPESRNVYLFDEIYESHKDPQALKSIMKAKLGNKMSQVSGCFGDRRIMLENEETNISIRNRFMPDFIFQVCTQKQMQGWHSALELLKRDLAGRSKFKVTRNCIKFINMIPKMVHDSKNPEIVNEKQETHMADMLRYYAVSRHSEGTILSEEGYSQPSIDPVTGYINISESQDNFVGDFRRSNPITKPKVSYNYNGILQNL